MTGGKYLVETHAHTSEVSACSELTARELVRLHQAAGYDALVVTDHYLPGEVRTEEDRDWFMQGYLHAKAAGDACGLVVLPGMELRFADHQAFEDFLVFLPDPGLYRSLQGLSEMGLERFYGLAGREGLLVYQAHPFRSYHRHPAPALFLDGVEVFNGNPTQQNHNPKAMAYAQKHGLRRLSGSDVHAAHGVGRGGIYVPGEALSPGGLVEYLRNTPEPEMKRMEEPEA